MITFLLVGTLFIIVFTILLALLGVLIVPLIDIMVCIFAVWGIIYLARLLAKLIKDKLE